MKKIWKKWIAMLLALAVMAGCFAMPALAAGQNPAAGQTQKKSLMEMIQEDDLSGMTADAVAHLVTWFTTNEPQSIFPVLERAVVASPAGKAVDQKYNAEHFTVTSFDGTKLNCTLFHTPKGCERNGKKHVVLCAHGFQVDQLVAEFQLPLFADLGYDVVTFDQRQSGLSDKTKCTMGYNEGKDCGVIASWIRQQYGEDVVLGLCGHSMGAATVMMYSSQDPNLAFLIEDCGYASLKGLMQDIQSKYLKFVDFDEFYSRALRYSNVNGVTYDDVEPIESIKKLDPNVPALFIHGTADLYVNPDNVTKLYNAKQGKKVMKTFKGAGHDQSQLQMISYNNTIREFIQSNNL